MRHVCLGPCPAPLVNMGGRRVGHFSARGMLDTLADMAGASTDANVPLCHVRGRGYEGDVGADGILPDGRGTWTSPDGSTYDGEWKAGCWDGRGTFMRSNGEVYKGEFKAGIMEGRGALRYPSGLYYSGYWTAGNKDGCGTTMYSNGQLELSFHKSGNAVGAGLRLSYDRQTAWRLRDGEKVGVISIDEARRVAEESGLVDGIAGIHDFEWCFVVPPIEEVKGDVYYGEYNAAGEYEGRGTYRWAKGGVYEGDYKAGKAEGVGIYTGPDGSSEYVGQWKANQRDGFGKGRDPEGNAYEGGYKADSFDGNGTLRNADGSVFVGFHFKGNAVGEGVAWLADGQTALRMRDGKRVEQISLEEARRICVERGFKHPFPDQAAPTSRLQRKLEKRRAARDDGGAAFSQPMDTAEAKARAEAAAAALLAEEEEEEEQSAAAAPSKSKRKKNKKKKGAVGGNSSANDATAAVDEDDDVEDAAAAMEQLAVRKDEAGPSEVLAEEQDEARASAAVHESAGASAAAPEATEDDAPDELSCPLTHEIMEDPVILVESSMTYERESIERWLATNDTDPMTGAKLTNKNIIANVAVRSMCRKYKPKV